MNYRSLEALILSSHIGSKELVTRACSSSSMNMKLCVGKVITTCNNLLVGSNTD